MTPVFPFSRFPVFEPMLAAFNVDLYILTFSAVTVLVTIWMGFRSAKKSKTASDFFVAGRSVSVGWNASAISGEYLSAASFMGIAGMVMSSGYDALWYPVCYACGYLFLLLFIAGPLRRFGAYTIPDFAEGRFDSPVFRKIAVVFVLFIGFFYTMPQMKGAGVTLAYIFPGLPYWAGVVLVGAVITLNVALGGMKGITLVQAFQYWIKMFAIAVPIFVLMAVYGHYGKQVRVNGSATTPSTNVSAAVERLQSAKTFQSGFPAPKQSIDLAKKIGVNRALENALGTEPRDCRQLQVGKANDVFVLLAHFTGWNLAVPDSWPNFQITLTPLTNWPPPNFNVPRNVAVKAILDSFSKAGLELVVLDDGRLLAVPATNQTDYVHAAQQLGWLSADRAPLPPKAPTDSTWLNPFGPLTTKAAKNAAKAIGEKAARAATNEVGRAVPSAPGRAANPETTVASAARRGEDTAPYQAAGIPLRPGLSPDQRMTVNLDALTVGQALAVYGELTGREVLPADKPLSERLDDLLGRKLSQFNIVTRAPAPNAAVVVHADGAFTAAEVKETIERHLWTNGLAVLPVRQSGLGLVTRDSIDTSSAATALSAASGAPAPAAGGATTGSGGVTSAEREWLAKHEKPLALLYTYSLIIAIVCGTAGLPHILVRFYTNPDGVAAKKTTMWVMILIGVFYVFPPVFGVLGRNLMPELYAGVGAKGTDKIVLELPRLLNEKYAPLGSILSGITCAGAFAAFMSTFSGLLVSMTGALAHDVYGRMLRPKSTPEQRMRMFKIGAVLIGAVAILLGMQVEQLQINFMVGQAFAIAAASYFPLLFMAVWWRKLTMKGAATGMLGGGLAALACISLTSFSDLAGAPNASAFMKLFSGLNDFWAWHPLLRILCEQPAIWAVPLAIVLMVIVSKLTAREVPLDSRMKMLVLHAPEQLGLKQEYIQEHQGPPGH